MRRADRRLRTSQRWIASCRACEPRRCRRRQSVGAIAVDQAGGGADDVATDLFASDRKFGARGELQIDRGHGRICVAVHSKPARVVAWRGADIARNEDRLIGPRILLVACLTSGLQDILGGSPKKCSGGSSATCELRTNKAVSLLSNGAFDK
jgi:hypothetical protein